MSAADRSRTDVFVLYGSRIGRDTLIYALGTAAVLPFSLVTVAILTRFLDPSEYGQLAILFVFAALLTTVYNLGSLQGTFIRVFGSAGEDEELPDEPDAAVGTKRRALGTGLLLTLAITAVCTVPLLLAAEPIADLLLGSAEHVGAVRWAAASAALGSIWRLVVNVFRLERRPRTFAWINTSRPAFVLACSVPLVAAGYGVEGAVAGTAIGTAAGVLLCIAIGRRSYVLAFDGEDARQIMRKGARFIPVIAGLWVAHNADVYVLSRFADASEVGLYRLAGRIAAFVSYFVSAFLMAWAPLERTSLFRGTYERYGRPGVRSKLVTYYVVIALSIVLLMAVSASALVRIAAPAYAGAAPLIAPVGLGLAFYGAFIVLVRTSSIRRKLLIYAGTALLSAVFFTGLALVLVPWLESYGAALSVILSMAGACAVYLVFLARSARDPIPYEWGRMGGALALGLGAYAVLRWVSPEAGDWVTAADVATVALFAWLLVALRIVPAAHLRPLWRMTRAMWHSRAGRRAVSVRIAELDAEERGALEAFVRDGLTPDGVASDGGPEPDVLHARFVRALRRLGWEEEPRPSDAAIGAYLLSREPPAERDAMARRLWASGIDPLELHELEDRLERLRETPRGEWPVSA